MNGYVCALRFYICGCPSGGEAGRGMYRSVDVRNNEYRGAWRERFGQGQVWIEGLVASWRESVRGRKGERTWGNRRNQ